MSAIRPISDLQFGVMNTEIGVIQAPEPGPHNMRYELTDFEWAAIRPFLPNKPCGVPRVNDRRVLNGIFWMLRSGAPGRDLPESSSGCTRPDGIRRAARGSPFSVAQRAAERLGGDFIDGTVTLA
jgi:hypothetical protein